jgi:hypothetical protein
MAMALDVGGRRHSPLAGIAELNGVPALTGAFSVGVQRYGDDRACFFDKRRSFGLVDKVTTVYVCECRRDGSKSTLDQGSPNLWERVRKPWEPVLPVRTGSGSDRFPTGPNSKFEFEFKK